MARSVTCRPTAPGTVTAAQAKPPCALQPERRLSGRSRMRNFLLPSSYAQGAEGEQPPRPVKDGTSEIASGELRDDLRGVVECCEGCEREHGASCDHRIELQH